MEHHHDNGVAVEGTVNERVQARLRDALAQRREVSREADGGGEGELEGDQREHDHEHAEALVTAQVAVGLAPLCDEALVRVRVRVRVRVQVRVVVRVRVWVRANQVEDAREGARHLLDGGREGHVGHRQDERGVDLDETDEVEEHELDQDRDRDGE